MFRLVWPRAFTWRYPWLWRGTSLWSSLCISYKTGYYIQLISTTINICSVETYLKVEGWCCKFEIVSTSCNLRHTGPIRTLHFKLILSLQRNLIYLILLMVLKCHIVTLALKNWNNQDSGSHQILYIGLHCWIFGFNNKNVLWNWEQGSNFYVNDYDWWRHNADNFIYSFSSLCLS